MLPDVGLTEMMVIAAVALIVVGPKDLPMLLRRLGQFMARIRGMAAEFRASFDEMARQSELDELRREVEAMRNARPLDMLTSPGATETPQDIFSDIENGLTGSGVQLHPPMSHQYDALADGASGAASEVAAPVEAAPVKPARRRAAPKPASAAVEAPVAPKPARARRPKVVP